MENALLISLSKQVALRRELDVVANNVANVNTSGYKSDTMMFNEYMMPVAKADAFPVPDKELSYVIDRATLTNYSAGTVETTGSEFDVALQGDGFFALQTPQGERYTRAGAFNLNAIGELVNPNGYKVLTDGGPITFTAQDGKISIGKDGTIATEQGRRGRLKIVTIKPSEAIKVGETLFNTTATATNDTTTRVLQGSIEKSNVSSVTEISRLIEINRAYQNIAQMVEKTQDLRRSAIERLSQVSA